MTIKTGWFKGIVVAILPFLVFQYAQAQEFIHQGFPKSHHILTIYHWDGASVWIEDGRLLPDPLNSNTPAEYFIEKKNGTAYDSAQRSVIQYNANNQAIAEYDQTFNGATWVYTNKDTFIYDGNGLETSAFKYDYNNGSWTYHRRYTFTYNTDGTEKEHLEESWNGSGWGNADQYFYTYSVGLLKLIERQTWTSGAWASSYQYIPNYVAGVETYEIVQQKSGSSWVNASKYEISSAISPPNAPDSLVIVPLKKKTGDGRLKLTWKDHAGNEDGFRIYRSTDGVSFMKTDSVAANVTDFTDTTLEASTQYYYKVLAFNASGVSPFTGIVSATTFTAIGNHFSDALAFGIFPNPSRGAIHIQYGGNLYRWVNLSVINLEGQCIYASKILLSPKGNSTIEAGSLPAGVYLLKVENNQGMYVQRLVILN